MTTQGEKLMLLVKRSDLSHSEIVEGIGYSRQYLAKLYKEKEIPHKALKKIISFFEVDEDYFKNEAGLSKGSLAKKPEFEVYQEEMNRMLDEKFDKLDKEFLALRNERKKDMSTPAEELLRFKELFDAGLLTKEEFDKQKKKLLSDNR